MNPNETANLHVSIQQMLASLLAHQQLQTEYAQNQQQASLKLEQTLSAVIEAVGKMNSIAFNHSESNSNPQAPPAAKGQSADSLNVADTGVANLVVRDQASNAMEVLPTNSGPASLTATRLAEAEKPKSLYQAMASPTLKTKSEPKREPALRQGLNTTNNASLDRASDSEPDTATESIPSQRRVAKSLYRTLAQEQSHSKDAEPDDEIKHPLSASVLSVLGTADALSKSKAVPSLSEESKPISNRAVELDIVNLDLDEPSDDDVGVHQLAEATLKQIETLLPKIDPLQAKLGVAPDIAESSCDVASEFEPNLGSVRRSASTNLLPSGASRRVEVQSVEDETLVESSDERSMLEQIHRFTETLSESTTFWKQVMIPKGEATGKLAVNSLDSTAGIAAQYENVSRSPYSH